MCTPQPAVTLLLQQLHSGQRDAAEALWRLYFPRLVRLARSHLQGLPRRAADEEDVALSAFDSFCRGAGDVRGHSAVTSPEDSSAGGDPFDRIAGNAPDPGFEAAVAESCRRLLDLLPDEQLRRIAVWKMEGHTNREIADQLGCVVETVERRLRLIRSLWQREMGE